MSHGHHIIPMKVLIKTIVALVILTGVTVVAALDVVTATIGSHAINTLIAILIASVKAYLVAAYFMGLKYDSRTHTLVLISSVGFVILLYLFSAIDIFSRTPIESTL
ncbi:MAG: cytochrome C oxidase subunit IV family protein [Bdellovibrionales bacterium]|nr:cytochrome C oxidase subunit IV family protein [Bdellovibrionales bacterium]